MAEITREVRFHREVSYDGDSEWVNEQLQEGQQLREVHQEKSNSHILCKMEWANEKIGTPGTPPSQDTDVIIPNDGIDESGYVREVWIECIRSIDFDTIEIKGCSYTIIKPYIHNGEKWIQGFKTEGTGRINLLPSPEIVVKYLMKTE